MHGGRFNIQSISAEINAHASANASLTDYVTGDFHALLLATHFDAQGCRFGTLLLTTPRSSGRTWVGQIWEHEFRNWIRLATATPPEEHDLPLAEGVTRGKRCVYSKAQDGLVVVRFSAKFPAAPSRQQIIGTLPVDYRPSEATSGAGKVGHESGDAASTATVELWGDGRLTVYGNTTGFINASGVVVFYAP